MRCSQHRRSGPTPDLRGMICRPTRARSGVPPVMTSAPVPGRIVAPWRGRLVVLVAIVLVGLNLRLAVAAVSPIVGQLRETFAISTTQVGLLGTIPVAAFAVFGTLAAPIGRRLGLEPAIILAMAFAVAGQLLRAVSPNMPVFLVWSALALGGMGMGNVLLPPLVKRYFPDR